MNLSPTQAIKVLNHQVVTRIKLTGYGGTKIKTVSTTDYQAVAAFSVQQIQAALDYTDDDLAQYGLRCMDSGLIGVNSALNATIFSLLSISGSTPIITV